MERLYSYVFGETKRRGQVYECVKYKSATGTNFAPGLRQEEEPNDVAIIYDRFIVREKYKTVRDVEGSFYDFYIVDNHYRYEDKYTPNIGKVTERIDGDISEITDGLMETYDLTAGNSEDIADCRTALEELYEMIIEEE